jgi:hypothetical protein
VFDPELALPTTTTTVTTTIVTEPPHGKAPDLGPILLISFFPQFTSKSYPLIDHKFSSEQKRSA